MAADAVAALLSGYRVSRLRNGWKALGHMSEWGFTTPRIECHLLCNVLFYRNSYLELRDDQIQNSIGFSLIFNIFYTAQQVHTRQGGGGFEGKHCWPGTDMLLGGGGRTKQWRMEIEVDIHSTPLLTTPIFVYLCING